MGLEEPKVVILLGAVDLLFSSILLSEPPVL